MRDLDLVLSKGNEIITPQQPTPDEKNRFGSTRRNTSFYISSIGPGGIVDFNFTVETGNIYLGIAMIARFQRSASIVTTPQIINGSETISGSFVIQRSGGLQTLVAVIGLVKAQGSSIIIRIWNNTPLSINHTMIRAFLVKIET